MKLRIFDFFSVRSIFISSNDTKSSIFMSGKATSKNITYGVHEWNKNNITLKKSNFLFLLCFKIAIIHFIPMCQPSGQRHNLFPRHFASNLMLPVYLLGIILVVNPVCNWKIARNNVLTNRFLEICWEKMPTGNSGSLTSSAFTMLCWRV